jgi:hypothetical protein
VFVFAVVIPGLFVLLLMGLGNGASSPAVGLGFIGYFIGIPVWIVAASIVLWRLCSARMRSIGVPALISFIVIPFALADWRFFLWLFRPFHAPFLLTILLLLAALVLWPDRADRTEAAGYRKTAPVVLGGCLAVQLILAVVSIVGSVGTVMYSTPGPFRLTAYANHYALWWNAAIAAAMAWTLIEAGRRPPDRSAPDAAATDTPSAVTFKSGSPPTFGRR